MEELTMAMAKEAYDAAWFNAKITRIEHDLAQAGQEYGPGGELVQVHTPWACGFVDRQGGGCHW